MVDVLNLAGADLEAGNFEPVPSGTYPATIVRFDPDQFTKGGENAKLPAGIPMINVGVQVHEGTTASDGTNVGKRWFWKSLVVAPAKIDGKPYAKKAFMDGILANFFIAAGYTPEEITGGEFDISDPESFIGRDLGVVVQLYKNTYKGEMDNKVNGFKPMSFFEGKEGAVAGSGLT